jgi:hypothetical protein
MTQTLAHEKKGLFRVGVLDGRTGRFEYVYFDDEERALDLVDVLTGLLLVQPDEVEALGWDDYRLGYILPLMRESEKGQP